MILFFIVEILLNQQLFLRNPIMKDVCLNIHVPVFYFLPNKTLNL